MREREEFVPKELARMEYNTEGGRVVYRDVYEDGSVGNWESADEVDPSNPDSFRKFRSELETQRGLNKPKEK